MVYQKLFLVEPQKMRLEKQELAKKHIEEAKEVNKHGRQFLKKTEKNQIFYPDIE